jgi:hypothetical protein
MTPRQAAPNGFQSPLGRVFFVGYGLQENQPYLTDKSGVNIYTKKNSFVVNIRFSKSYRSEVSESQNFSLSKGKSKSSQITPKGEHMRC